jgi:hypothetical protein
MDLFPWLLFAHVLGAIIAFGPSFSAPIIGAYGAQEPEHRHFATRLGFRLSKVQTTPLAVFVGLTGVALIVVGQIDMLAERWLISSIVLYLIALAYAIWIQTPTVARLIELSAGGPPPGAPAGPPPPEILALVAKTKRGGMLLTALVVLVVLLMVVKPAI